MQNVFHRFYKEPSLDFRQLYEIQTSKVSVTRYRTTIISTVHSMFRLRPQGAETDCFSVRKGPLQSCARAPFCITTLSSCSHETQAFPCYEWQLFVLHMSAQACPSPVASQLGEGIIEEENQEQVICTQVSFFSFRKSLSNSRVNIYHFRSYQVSHRVWHHLHSEDRMFPWGT